MRFYYLASLIFFCIQAVAQDNYTFTSPVSKGEVPKAFLGLSEEKFKEDIAQNKHSKLEQQYSLEAQYGLDNILHSGKVIFNDDVTNYINDVLDNLLAGNEELRSKLSVYTIKSPVVNAFCTKQGVILVTTGLLAQLENEAQLAFILGHESVHFTENHGIENFEESHNSSSGKGKYRNMNNEERILTKHLYSRENELEADNKGLMLLEKSPYSCSTILNVFDILKYSYLHFDEIPFDTTYFEGNNYEFPDGYFLSEVSDIKIDDDFEEEKSTHPSAESRQKAIRNTIEKSNLTGKSNFLLPEDRFHEIRKLCRYENTRQFLLSSRYSKAIYNSYLLEKTYGPSVYTRESIGYALYAIAVRNTVYQKFINELVSYTRHYTDSDENDYYSTIEGEYQQVVHFVGKLSTKEKIILALRYNLSVLEQTNSEMTEKLIKQLLEQLIVYSEMTADDFSQKTAQELDVKSKNSTLVASDTIIESNKPLTKLEKIKRKNAVKKEIEIEVEGDYYVHAFVDYFENGDLSSKFEFAKETIASNKKRDKDYYESFSQYSRTRNNPDNKGRIKRKGFSLGIDKITMLSPWVSVIDERKENEVRFQNSEKTIIDLNDRMNALENKIGIEVNVLDPHKTSISVEEYNAHNLLKEYYLDKINHLSIDYISPVYNEIQELKEFIGSDNTMLMGNYEYIESRPGKIGVMMGGILFFPSLPFAIWYAATTPKTTLYFSVVINIKRDTVEFIDYKEMRTKNYDAIKNQYLYYTLHQLHNK